MQRTGAAEHKIKKPKRLQWLELRMKEKVISDEAEELGKEKNFAGLVDER